MNQYLTETTDVCGITCFMACTTTKNQRPKNGASVWHAPK